MNTLLPAAERRAHEAGEARPGAEHLVLAALELPEDSARRAFTRAGADPDVFIAAVGGEVARVGTPVGRSRGPLRTAPSAQRVFRRVVDLIREEKSRLYGAYIVLAAAQSDDENTTRAIRAAGIQPEELAAAARAELDELEAL